MPTATPTWRARRAGTARARRRAGRGAVVGGRGTGLSTLLGDPGRPSTRSSITEPPEPVAERRGRTRRRPGVAGAASRRSVAAATVDARANSLRAVTATHVRTELRDDGVALLRLDRP